MQAADQPTESVAITNSQIIDTWNQERTNEELRSFVSWRLSANPLSEAALVE